MGPTRAVDSSIDWKTVAKNLKEQLVKSSFNSLSYRQLATRLRTSRTTVSNHLSAKGRISQRFLERWAALLKVSEAELTSVQAEPSTTTEWRDTLRLICSREKMDEFRAHCLAEGNGATADDAYGIIRHAIRDGCAAGHIDLGWTENRSIALDIQCVSGLANVAMQVVDSTTPYHLFEAAADTIWQYVMRVFNNRQRMVGSITEAIVIRGAIGSGYTVGRVMAVLIERIAKQCRSIKQPDGLPLTFDFHPMASSIHTHRPADNIPSVFLHEAIDKWGLHELKERVYPTPDNYYHVKDATAWFHKTIDFVVTSVAATDDPDSMLIQHLRKLKVRVSKSVGEVQFRPYTEDGFIDPADRRLPKTLVPIAELPRFCQMESPSRERPLVIMVAGPCGVCQRLKDHALLPTLRNPSLRVFNHLAVDERTAKALLARLRTSKK